MFAPKVPVRHERGGRRGGGDSLNSEENTFNTVAGFFFSSTSFSFV